jgi:hypothetical protein
MAELFDDNRVLSDQNWFDEAAAKKVVIATKLPCKNGLDFARIAMSLSGLTNYCVDEQLFFNRSPSDWREAVKHVEAALSYNDFAKSWSKTGESMMRLSKAQIESLTSFKEYAVARASVRAPRTIKGWVEEFYLEAMGLYAAIFAKEPMSYVNDSNKEVADASNHFIQAVLAHINLMQGEVHYSQRGFLNRDKRADWGIHDPGTIGTNIAKYKKVIHEVENRPVWMGKRDMYLSGF